MKYTYFFLLFFTLAYPLYKSFENKIQYYKNWKNVFAGIFASSFLFVMWDVWFTGLGVWRFNEKYIFGIKIMNLPVEEWLFFFIIPFSCVFIYEVLKFFYPQKFTDNKNTELITLILASLLMITSIIFYHRLYTFVSFSALSILLFAHLFIIKSNYLQKFYVSWLVCLLPFAIVNGILTGLPVLIYNDNENLGIRIFTIPVEDVFYGMLDLLLTITIYEWLKERHAKKEL